MPDYLITNHGLLWDLARPSSAHTITIPRDIPKGRVLLFIQMGDLVFPPTSAPSDGLGNVYSGWSTVFNGSVFFSFEGIYIAASICKVTVPIPAGTTITNAYNSASSYFGSQYEYLRVWELEGADNVFQLGSVRGTAPGIPWNVTENNPPTNKRPASWSTTINNSGTVPGIGDFCVMMTTVAEYSTGNISYTHSALSGVQTPETPTSPNRVDLESSVLLFENDFFFFPSHYPPYPNYYCGKYYRTVSVFEGLGELGNPVQYTFDVTAQGVSALWEYMTAFVWVKPDPIRVVSFIRHPLMYNLQTAQPADGGSALSQQFASSTPTGLEASLGIIFVDVATDVTRTLIRVSSDGVTWYLYKKGAAWILLYSLDSGNTWINMTTITSDYEEVTYAWSTDGAYMLFMMYSVVNQKWYMAVGYFDETGTFILSTPTDIGVTARRFVGTLQQRIDGVWEFMYRNLTTVLIIRCDSVGIDGSNSGWS